MLSKNFTKNNERKVITTELMEDFEKYKSENPDNKIIGTHSGVFHSDEVLSTLLLKFHPEYTKSIVIRTRNDEILNKCDIVVDVGSKIEPQNMRFDHHMKDFNEVLDPNVPEYNNIKLSSAGLVYKYLGHGILENILKQNDLYEQNKTHLDSIYKMLYINFIMGVDAKDNGINQYETKEKPKYLILTDYCIRIARLNPEWYLENVDVNERFKQGWDIAEEELYYKIQNLACSYFLAYDIVEKAVMKALKNNSVVIELEKPCPWKKCLYVIEKKLGVEGKFLFCLSQKSENEWVTSTVSVNETSFEFRLGFPNEWRGFRNEKLDEVTGIKGGIFVHATGFVAFWKTEEAAKKALEITLSKNVNDNMESKKEEEKK